MRIFNDSWIRREYARDIRIYFTHIRMERSSYRNGCCIRTPAAVENAKYYGVKLVVRSSFHEEEGTEVVEEVGFEQRDVVTGIAFEREVARIALVGVPLASHGLATVFGELASRGMNVDVIVQSVVHENNVDVSFTVKDEDATRAVDILESLRDTLQFQDLVCEKGLGKVSIVGAGMISNPGVAAGMFRVLADTDIAVKMVSTSEIKVSCIIEANLVEKTVGALHEAFLEHVEAVSTN